MPWHLVQGAVACDGGWAVVKDDTGEIEGCHTSRVDAVDQLRALYAQESDAGLDVAQEDPLHGNDMWHAVAHVEGVSTGARVWLPGSLSWREPPFALHWQIRSNAHNGQPETVQVGMVDRMVRAGNTIHAWGSIDLDSPEGAEFGRKLATGFIRGISIGLGSERVEYDLIWPTDAIAGQEVEPEHTVFRDYKIGELTAVSVPGQEGAYIEALPPLTQRFKEMAITTAAAVGSHDTGTSDVPWDKGVNEKRLPSPMPTATARKFYAWIEDGRIEDGKIPKDAGRFPHHLVSEDGRPGVASTAGCSSGLGRLHGTDIPSADRRGVYNHLRAHLIDSGRDRESIPAFEAGILTAGGSWPITPPDLPPAWWFTEPDCPPAAAVTITDEGRIYGYVAPARTNHRTYARRSEHKTVASLGKIDFSGWMRETVVDGGGRVLAGPVTMECMHAPKQGYGTLDRRNQYYEDSCAIVARVAVGQNDHGMWLAGALVPGIESERLHRLMMCDVSLDVQPHPDRPGWQDFIAVLAVPVGGWPKSRTAPSVPVTTVVETEDELLVTAAAVPLRFEQRPASVEAAVIRTIAARVGM